MSIESQAIAGLIDRQRHEQEALFRAFTNGVYHLSFFKEIHLCHPPHALASLIEISGEIKGERLRFVEAMKEATAINIQSELSVLQFAIYHGSYHYAPQYTSSSLNKSSAVRLWR